MQRHWGISAPELAFRVSSTYVQIPRYFAHPPGVRPLYGDYVLMEVRRWRETGSPRSECSVKLLRAAARKSRAPLRLGSGTQASPPAATSCGRVRRSDSTLALR